MMPFRFPYARRTLPLSAAALSALTALAAALSGASLAACDDSTDGTGGDASSSSTSPTSTGTNTTNGSSGTGQTAKPGDVLETLQTNVSLYGTVVVGSQTLLELDRRVDQLAPDDSVIPFVDEGLDPALEGTTALLVAKPYNTQVATPPTYCRYVLPAGTPDTAWGSNGCSEAPFAYMTTAGVQALPSGGYIALINPQCSNGCDPGEEAFGVFRMGPDGNADVGFDMDGFKFTTIADDMTATAFGVQSSGDVVVSGYTGLYQLKLFRIHPDGSLDATFAGDGILDQDVAGGRFLKILGDDSILLLGTTNGVYRVEKYTKDGAADAAFGTAGRVDLETLTNSTFDNDLTPRGFTVDAQGRVYVVGTRADVEDGPGIPLVIRLTAAGAPDASFGDAGIVRLQGPTEAPYEEAFGIGLEVAGNVLVGVGTKGFQNAIVRLAP